MKDPGDELDSEQRSNSVLILISVVIKTILNENWVNNDHYKYPK